MIHLQIEERGFLTLFMDINGFGNWCRRWSLLQGKPQFSKLNLLEGVRKCSTGQVVLHPIIESFFKVSLPIHRGSIHCVLVW